MDGTIGRAVPTERRLTARAKINELPWLSATRLRPGRDVVLIDLSRGGALIEGSARLLPGTRAVLQPKTIGDLIPPLGLTGALTTAGGLAFVGDLDRRFRAFDVSTGEILWETRLGAAVSGFPISYAVGGKQYVAVPSGLGIFRVLTGSLSPDIYQPTGGSALYVFELPD